MMEPQDVPQLLVLAGVLLLLLLSACWGYFFPVQGEDPDALAEKRAAELLREVLSDTELRQLADHGYLEVPSPNLAGRSYRIPAHPGWVEVYDSERLAMKLCVQPIRRLPEADVVLMHKLMIEGDEASYLRKANVVYGRHPVAVGSRPHVGGRVARVRED